MENKVKLTDKELVKVAGGDTPGSVGWGDGIFIRSQVAYDHIVEHAPERISDRFDPPK